MPGIQKRGKNPPKWTVTVYDPRMRNRQRYVGTYSNEPAARAALEKARTQVQRMRAPKMCTVAEWCDRWLREHPRPAPRTNKHYRQALPKIKETIGHYRLADVDRSLAKWCIEEWDSEYYIATAFAMFNDAYKETMILANPFKGLRRPRQIGRRDLDAPTEAEILELANTARDSGLLGSRALGYGPGAIQSPDYGPEFRALILWLGFVGIRPGELCCIRRADIDHDRRLVAVRYSLDGDGGEKFPKNNKQRIVTIPPAAFEALGDVPVRVNTIGTPSPYLFHTKTGKRLSTEMLNHYFRTVLTAWGKRRDLQPYHLRHGCATLLLERGCSPHVVAYQLGHTDGGVLVQTLYGHPSDEGMRQLLLGAFEDDAPRPTLKPAKSNGKKPGNHRNLRSIQPNDLPPRRDAA